MYRYLYRVMSGVGCIGTFTMWCLGQDVSVPLPFYVWCRMYRYLYRVMSGADCIGTFTVWCLVQDVSVTLPCDVWGRMYRYLYLGQDVSVPLPSDVRGRMYRYLYLLMSGAGCIGTFTFWCPGQAVSVPLSFDVWGKMYRYLYRLMPGAGCIGSWSLSKYILWSLIAELPFLGVFDFVTSYEQCFYLLFCCFGVCKTELHADCPIYDDNKIIGQPLEKPLFSESYMVDTKYCTYTNT